ncbi:class III lanthionine synthetase LanKC [Xylanimonas protaetiae]|nr:class III lanthionine synthetase LanKC [Xylanimonas protaetiae]
MIAHFATTDALFYDRPSTAADEPSFSVADLDWVGWQHDNREPWSHWHPIGVWLPDQGWKVHVSTVARSADEVLRRVSEFCWTHRLSFKHLEGHAQLATVNAKDADRGSAGKFITVYPEDQERLHLTLTGLDAVVGGMPGPYILSDLRWRNGPVYTRFGAFKKMWTRDDRGQPIPALRHPAGHAVEDPRTAGFTPPPWVPMPNFLERPLASLSDAAPPADFGYDITRVLHYSNAGGVYEARGKNGERVVLKEGRPHAGITPDGRDAATRVSDEEAALLTLAGPDVVAVRDAFTLHGHRFLALEHVEGTPLNAEIARRSPSIHADSTPSDYAAYREWALRISDALSRAVSRLHAAGHVHGDLHPRNVIVRPDGHIVLIDFEMARPATEHTTTLVGAPGFVAPDRRGGTAADRYALACIRAALFTPLTALIPLDSLKARDLLENAMVTYNLDDAWIGAQLADLGLSRRDAGRRGAGHDLARLGPAGDWDTTTQTGIAAVQHRIDRALHWSADLSRVDRLWPGDPQQFHENGMGLAHGAAGVVHALASANLDVPAGALDWLTAAASRPNPTTGERPVGLFDGLAGVAWLHRHHGRTTDADSILDTLRTTDLDSLGPDLYSGLPGLGLLLVAESPRHPELLDRADAIASRLTDYHTTQRPRLDPTVTAHVARTDHAGLMWGASGTALFALRLYERTSDARHLHLAMDALDYDLAHCAVADDGSLQVNEGWRLNPYLASGSVGVGLVAAQALRHAPDPERYVVAIDGITRAASAPFTIESGLFYGRAGMVHYLLALSRLGLATEASAEAVTRHVDQFRLHALRHGDGIGFPGRGLMRMSCDLATGSAGILTALRAHELAAFDPLAPGWSDLVPLLLPTQQPHDADPRAVALTATGRR